MTQQYPYANELITDPNGNIVKVIIDWQDYLHFLGLMEDQALLNAMLETKNQFLLSRDEALKELEK